MNIKQAIAQDKRIFKVFEVFGGRGFVPLFLLVHLTLRCNRNCSFCYQKDEEFYKNYASDMKKKDFEDLINLAKKDFIIKPRIHLFGGEPLVYPDFSKVLEILKKNKFKTSFTTNGLLLSDYIDIICNSGVDQVNISMDFPTKSPNEKREAEKDFNMVAFGIRALKESLKKRKLLININCVITEANYNRLSDFAELFVRKNIPIDTLTFEHSYIVDRIIVENIDTLKAQISKILKIKSTFVKLFIPNIRIKDIENFYTHNKFPSDKCYLPWLGLNIMPNLDVTPGGGVLGCNTVTGNVKASSLKDLWNNESMRNFRKNILNCGVSEKCKRCCHRQYY